MWLTIVAMLIGAMGLLPTGSSQTTTVPRIYIDPAEIPGGGAWGHVGDVYYMSVKIENVENLWSAGFKITFAPYTSVVAISELFEGGFLSEDGFYPANLAYTLDLFHGTVYCAITRIPMGDIYGVYGNGTLMTFKLKVMEAGQSPLGLIETTLLDPTGTPIVHTATGSLYNGIYVAFQRVAIVPGRRPKVGTTINFKTKVYNPTDTPLRVKVRYDITRLEDGRLIVIRTGQEYFGWGVGEDPPTRIEYLYANGFTGSYGAGWGWNYEGTAPYLGAVGDGNFVWTDAADMLNPDGGYPGFYPYTGKYDFEDIAPLAANEYIGNVQIEGYTLYGWGLDESNDLDTYMRTPVTEAGGSVWIGSLWGDGTYGWHTTRWTTDTVSTLFPTAKTETGLNGVRVRFVMYWVADDLPHGRVDIDALRLKVSIPAKWANPLTAPEFIVPPYSYMELDPVVWTATTDHIGTYHGIATIEYTENGLKWNSWGSKTKTFSFVIRP